ncbi:nima-related protein kinase nima1 [Cyclospora cayetanensis]|uniref:non-specific serine/threonine protein kinase n=1 Tax=Cyclospora cayetanensis TaxID=88456 RepID=A0A1D3D081_9EIME|nr:nima-related protein kinase nima1 [Cyclospora cayetanensis]
MQQQTVSTAFSVARQHGGPLAQAGVSSHQKLIPPDDARMAEFEVIRPLGQGQYGKVSLVRHKETGALLCWKAICYAGLRSREKQQLVSEVNVMRSLDHPHIVRYYEHVVQRRQQALYILMEFCDGGDLHKQIETAHKHLGGIQEDRILQVLLQLLSALAYCHEGVGLNRVRILHRDLKPCNIFLCSDPRAPGDPSRLRVKIGDFGLSRHLSLNSMAHSCVGTPHYWSPELLNEGPKTYDSKTDLWSLGCLLYEMATGKTPFAAAQQMQQLRQRVALGPKLPIPGRQLRKTGASLPSLRESSLP